MNETIQTLISRRSPESDLQQILEAGMYAASGMGIQPVTMVVVQDKETIAKLTAMNAKIMGTDSDPMYGAPTIVVVLADMEKSANAWSDGCLVMGNLMNAAASLGIGSCWINRAKEEFESAEGKALLRQWNLPVEPAGTPRRRRPLHPRLRRRPRAGSKTAQGRLRNLRPLISYRQKNCSNALCTGTAAVFIFHHIGSAPNTTYRKWPGLRGLSRRP